MLLLAGCWWVLAGQRSPGAELFSCVLHAISEVSRQHSLNVHGMACPFPRPAVPAGHVSVRHRLHADAGKEYYQTRTEFSVDTMTNSEARRTKGFYGWRTSAAGQQLPPLLPVLGALGSRGSTPGACHCRLLKVQLDSTLPPISIPALVFIQVADKVVASATGGHSGCGHAHGLGAKQGPAADSCCAVEVLAGGSLGGCWCAAVFCLGPATACAADTWDALGCLLATLSYAADRTGHRPSHTPMWPDDS